jgi:murein DD-endopeptidase MepM/ murein hydrolase activator NlpD
MRSNKHWTVLIVSARGRATRRVFLPAWLGPAFRTGSALLLCGLIFGGWQLQALLGLDGPRVAQLGALPWSSARGSLFMSLATSRPGPTQSELLRRAALQRAARLGLGDRRAASMMLGGTLDRAWRDEAERGPKGDGTLRWPVRSGWFGRGYGSGSGGYHLAVDINAESGTDVLAAAPGLVGYSGRELRGFGNVVLIVHPGGWITLYAHNQRNFVVAGQRVQQGETIAALGSTGRSMGPHVHFELIHDGRNCDPMPLVAPGPDSYRNFAARTAPVTWPANTPRPDAVRCKRRMAHPQHEDDESGASGTLAVSLARP